MFLNNFIDEVIKLRYYLLLIYLLQMQTGSVKGQCDNNPVYLTPSNSTGNLAFPAANWDEYNKKWSMQNEYPAGVVCTWIIRAPVQHVIQAKFLFFNTERDYDFVKIYESPDRLKQLFVGSGNQSGDWIIHSEDELIVIDFESDEVHTQFGFLLAFRYEPKACINEGVEVRENQLIAVPPFNLRGALPGPIRYEEDKSNSVVTWLPISPYSSWLNCTWRLVVDPRQLLKIDVLTFDTTPADVMSVWQIGRGKAHSFLEYGGDNIPQTSFNSSKDMVVTFHSYGGDHGGGFLLNVTYITRACSSEPQLITSPNGEIAYPKGNYDTEKKRWKTEELLSYGPDNCVWELEAPEGYILNITIVHFETRPADKLKILNGNNLLFNHGGDEPSRRHFTSPSRSIKLIFSPTEDTDKSGFLIRYNWVLKDCEYELTGQSGEISSPYYPSIYRSEVKCVWKIKPSKGHMVHLFIQRIRIDQADTIQIIDGKRVIKITRDQPPTKRLIELRPSGSIVIKFKSDQHNNKGYFFFTYNTFKPGSCDFFMTTCGWSVKDPLQAWAFLAKNGTVISEEQSNIGFYLPRGYKAIFASPILYPVVAPKDKNQNMCLTVKYQLSGSDAYQLSVELNRVQSKLISNVSLSGVNNGNSSTNLLTLHGPQGNKMFVSAVNFSVNQPYQIRIVYERGYGPHYKAILQSVELKEDFCGGELDALTDLSCNFVGSLCGWINTHNDHKNWQLTDKGIVALVKGIRIREKQEQRADLVSPMISSKDLFRKSSTVCLKLYFKIHTSSAEFRVIIKSHPSSSEKQKISKLVWSQGRVKTLNVLEAQITFHKEDLPDKFNIILEAVSVGISEGPTDDQIGVQVQNISISEDRCGHGPTCYFNEGFCSWRVSYTGATVWYIDAFNKESKENGSYASVLSHGGPGDMTSLRSETIYLDTPHFLKFKYFVAHTNQCLEVALEKKTKNSKSTEKAESGVIWEQCRGKGSHWLNECLDLPNDNSYYDILINAGTGTHDSQVRIDDVIVEKGQCNVTSKRIEISEDMKNISPQWICEPNQSFCGLTQPLVGSKDWVYIDLENEEPINHSKWAVMEPQSDGKAVPEHELHAEVEEEGFKCPSGDIIQLDWICDGTVDCPFSDADEVDCDKPRNKVKTSQSPSGIETLISESKCSDGTDLEISWICDGVQDCLNGEDEKDCQNCESGNCNATPELGGGVCTGGTFTCHSGRRCPDEGCPLGLRSPCLPRIFVCDEFEHCNNGEDETGCESIAKPHLSENKLIFEPTDINWNNKLIRNQNTGMLGNYSSEYTMTCSHGLVIPKAWKCDGRKDCPLDGLDELGCYHCKTNEYNCMSSGVCIAQSAVCDGVISGPTCTDEDFCSDCPHGKFACNLCLDSYKICDGVWDCSDGADERECATLQKPTSNTQNLWHVGPCNFQEYKCPYDGRCVSMSAICDRKVDCEVGEEELKCLDDNTEVNNYISVKPSMTSSSGPWEKGSSRIVSPTLLHPKEAIAIFSFSYRLDSWTGSSNFSLSIEIVNEDDVSIGISKNALWRQSGHKGIPWLHETLIIPPTVPKYKLSFIVTNDENLYFSQQLNLAKMKYYIIQPKAVNNLGNILGSCNFKNSFCGWTQPYIEGKYSWVYANASPHTRRTGPISGYDKSSSGFIFADSVEGAEGDTADLLSPPLLLPSDTKNICFKFALFMYGTHVAKVSVHTLQDIEGRPNTAELYHAIGARGLSWEENYVNIGSNMLRDPKMPFTIVIRAVKGNGPEGDIALDSIKIMSGKCEDKPYHNFSIVTQPALLMPEARALTAGPSLTPVPTFNVNSQSSNVLPDPSDLCSWVTTCSECVTAPSTTSGGHSGGLGVCSWCDSTKTCSHIHTPMARACPSSYVIKHNTTLEGRKGPESCPRLIPTQDQEILVAADTNPVLSFSVHNIQPKEMGQGWTCVYNLNEPNQVDSIQKDQGELSHPKLKPMGLINNINKEKETKETKNENNNGTQDDSSIKDYKKGTKQLLSEINTKKDKIQNDDKLYKIQGHFQGTIENGYGSGIIKCGDGKTLISSPLDSVFSKASVKLISPSGGIIDNTVGVHLLVYRCEAAASTCSSCMTVNSTLACGWCREDQVCTTEPLCKKGIWSDDLCPKDYIDDDDDDDSDDDDQNDDIEEIKDDNSDYKLLDGVLDSPGDTFEVDTLRDNLSNKSNKKKTKKRNRKQKNNQDNEFETNKHPHSVHKIGMKSRMKSGKQSVKESVKMKGRGFLRLPHEDGVFIARDLWRLHTGKQYYVPVKKITLINLGFVRQVNYGNLSDEKARTVLLDGVWKKASGYFVDLFEKIDRDPITSIVTTSRDLFQKLISQLNSNQ